MLEKGLHAGNLAAAFGVIATTADLTLAGGAATMFGAALSGVSLATGTERTAKNAAKDIARNLDAQMSQTHLSDDQQIWLRQLLAAFPPQDGDFTAADMDGAKLTALLVKRIQESDADPELKQALALDAFSRVLPRVFQAAIDRDIASIDSLAAMAKETLSRIPSETAHEKRVREASQLMKRHTFEEMMEGAGTNYSEMTIIIELTREKNLSIKQLRRIIEDNHD